MNYLYVMNVIMNLVLSVFAFFCCMVIIYVHKSYHAMTLTEPFLMLTTGENHMKSDTYSTDC